jgi:hypothetical protein
MIPFVASARRGPVIAMATERCFGLAGAGKRDAIEGVTVLHEARAIVR